MALVIAKKSAVESFTRTKSDKETKNELFFGKSGAKLRTAVATAMGLTKEDKIWMATDTNKKGVITQLGIFKVDEPETFGYKLTEKFNFSGKDISKALLELAGLTEEEFVGKVINFTVDVENPLTVATEDGKSEFKVFEVKFKDVEAAKVHTKKTVEAEQEEAVPAEM